MKCWKIFYICLLASIHLNIQFELNINTPGIQFWPRISAWQKINPKMVKKVSRLLQNCGYNVKEYGFEVREQAANLLDLFGSYWIHRN